VNWQFDELVNRTSPIHEFASSPNDNGAATAARICASGLKARGLGT